MLKKNILIVEDDNDNQELLKELIDAYTPNCFCTSVYDGEEALQESKNKEYDLVFMDMSIPKKNGYDVTKELRENNNYKSVPIIALTGNVLQGMKEKAINSGCNEFLEKPCHPMKMIDTIKKYLDNKKKIFTQ